MLIVSSNSDKDKGESVHFEPHFRNGHWKMRAKKALLCYVVAKLYVEALILLTYKVESLDN